MSRKPKYENNYNQEVHCNYFDERQSVSTWGSFISVILKSFAKAFNNSHTVNGVVSGVHSPAFICVTQQSRHNGQFKYKNSAFASMCLLSRHNRQSRSRFLALLQRSGPNHSFFNLLLIYSLVRRRGAILLRVCVVCFLFFSL